MKKSRLFKLDFNDLLKGVLVAFITALLTSLLQVLQSGGLPNMEALKVMGITSITAAVAYLVKNLLTNSKDDFGAKENV